MKYQGCVETIEEGKIVGWCAASDGSQSNPFVSIYDGDHIIGTAKTDIYRQDLLHLGGSGFHGFAFSVPDRFVDGVARVFSVFAGASLEELAGSPVRVRLERAGRSGKRFGPKRAAIVCWNLSHNPAGRAHVLYKLLGSDWNPELVGPIWQRFGSDLWAPLKNEALTVRSFQPSTLIDVWREGATIALTQPYDLVIICGPRLPGLIVGMQIAEQSRCPIIIDIDQDDRVLTSQSLKYDVEQELIEEPYGATGTEISYQNLAVANAITVSNSSLERLYPGRVIRHARDEAVPQIDRHRARQRFGFAETDFVIAFIGSARSHKGLLHVISALQAGADRSVKLLLAGSIPDQIDRAIKAAGLSEQVVMHNEFDMSELGSFMAAADLVPVLQDPDAEISQTQMPAKLTDALQHGVRVVAYDVPPFRDIAEKGVIDIIKGNKFAEYLSKVRSLPPQLGAGDCRRRVFEEEFSFAVNRPRLVLAIREAFAHFDPIAPAISRLLQELLAKTRAARAVANGFQEKPHRQRTGNGQNGPDIAFFWKQNDSGLFGRRSDMVVKYLLRSERIGKIVHFDHTVDMSDMRAWANARQQQRRHVGAMQWPRTIDRALELADEPFLARRLFLNRPNRSFTTTLAGRSLGTVNQYAEFVDKALRAAGLEPARTIAWVCPVVHGFSQLHGQLGFHKVIADLIDDQRAWPHSSSDLDILQSQYESTLRDADLVFTNCEGNRQRFAWARADIIVIPNGAEIHSPPEPIAMPEPLRAWGRPIIGYVGNLRERIDWELIRLVTAMRPSWNVVLAGPVEDSRVPNWVADRPNVILPGPVPYEASRSWISSFDVAIMPHLRLPITESMNPLKLYNYLAAGVPVVTTPVANIDEVSDLVSIRDTPEDFISAIESLLTSPRVNIPSERLESFSWEQRVSAMMDMIDKLL
jgi:glycosyltransferase involved in cell wall biosynthesis